jgi:hypothetical protein
VSIDSSASVCLPGLRILREGYPPTSCGWLHATTDAVESLRWDITPPDCTTC